jgi:hypothetical protein
VLPLPDRRQFPARTAMAVLSKLKPGFTYATISLTVNMQAAGLEVTS